MTSQCGMAYVVARTELAKVFGLLMPKNCQALLRLQGLSVVDRLCCGCAKLRTGLRGQPGHARLDVAKQPTRCTFWSVPALIYTRPSACPQFATAILWQRISCRFAGILHRSCAHILGNVSQKRLFGRPLTAGARREGSEQRGLCRQACAA